MITYIHKVHFIVIGGNYDLAFQVLRLLIQLYNNHINHSSFSAQPGLAFLANQWHSHISQSLEGLLGNFILITTEQSKQA